MNIKEFLEMNSNKKVSSIQEELLAMISKLNSSTGKTFYRDEDGNILAIRCYYYKRWMPLVGPNSVEFGTKTSSTTGFNTMCKEGVKAWTRMNKSRKELDSRILDMLMSGELTHDEVKSYKSEQLEKINTIEPTDLGYDTLEECLDNLV